MELNLKRTARSRIYRGELGGEELFDEMDRIRDEMDPSPGRRLNSGEWEDILEGELVRPACREKKGRRNDMITKADYKGTEGRLEVTCVVVEN